MFPRIRSAWSSLLVAPEANSVTERNFQFFSNNSSPTGFSMKITENAHNNYISKIQEHIESSDITVENFIENRTSYWTAEQINFFYSLLVRNPFKFDDKNMAIKVQYCYLIELARETHEKLKSSNYLSNISDKEMYEQLISMQILSPYPIEETSYDSNQRDKHIWYVLTELMKYNIIGDKNG